MSIKVFIVDDSPFMRKIFSDILSDTIGLEVIGTSRSGRDTIRRLDTLKPDLILMDVNMPGLNGFEALKLIKEKRSIRIIMMSSQGGEDVTIKALESGAEDFIGKPQDLKNTSSEFKKELVYRIKALFKDESVRKERPQRQNPQLRKRVSETTSFSKQDLPEKVEAITIGASTGGPRALMQVVCQFPADLSIPVFIVQHMPAGFTASFANRLNSEANVTVVEAMDGLPVENGIVYIAPGNYHMMVENKTIRLLSTPKMHGVRPAVDVLFESVAKEYGSKVMGVILTGMGYDGTQGLYKIKTAGGYSLAQDEATSVVYGMPKNAVENGVVDQCIGLTEISEILNQIIKVS
ncbi:chemotaxis response regulator protein-glutamate methylesterase [Desemzia sp. RIT804]|uniref:protein-glutamate methylesterase/protein-glutamine glutaminase n=1 Tax=Desemzia sp. RIT 804 TaxID=2810209 RepID=UPI00194F3F65|nr:chemotaxis response regulator protein-glutamate methylesterase [Desemzia sp. RIT 804]MBM6614722.1 chemotaxis response regulator protein-glutamate methylesterase [Desemzia sp. RIT 804]